MKSKIVVAILFILSFVLHHKSAISQVSIANVECIYSLCETRANILVDCSGSRYENLRFEIYDYSAGTWSGLQTSSSFIVEKGQSYFVWVEDVTNGSNYDSKYFKVENINTPILLDENITHVDCDHDKGEIDISLIGGYRYISLTKDDNIQFTQPLLTSTIRDFTVEILVRLDDTSSELDSRGTVGLIGQDNTLEFGFRGGAPSFYLYTDRGAVDYNTSIKKIDDDHKWHQIVVRGNGSKLEILVDGNVWFKKDYNYSFLRSDHSGIFSPVSIGQKVWGDYGGRGFNGDVGRATFWKRYLSDSDLSKIRQGAMDVETDVDCMAAYMMHKRTEGRLPAKRGEDGTFSSSRIQWHGSYTCNWTYPGGATSTLEDISNLNPGTYNVTVLYNPEDCGVIRLDEQYTVKNNKNLSATIAGTDMVCEGNELTLSTSAAGGSTIQSPIYTYQWQEYTSGTWQNITGAVNNVYTTSPNTHGIKRYRVVTQSNYCTTNSPEKQVIVEELINTQVIVHH